MIVLLVSTSPFLRNIMKYTLEGPNVFTLEAATGQEALFLYQSNPVGLVIYDLHTTLDDSLEAISNIRDWDSQAKIVITVIPGQNASIAAALELGAIDFVEKPFSQFQFRQQIYNLLQLQLENNQC